ncbi:MAG: hypothetical protein ACRD2O_00120 [Terriglobia bacterium]
MNPAISGSVLVVEDSTVRIEWFRKHLPNARYAKTPIEAMQALSWTPDVVFLDFDLGRANSIGIAAFLADNPPALCIIHSANEKGVAVLKGMLPGAWIIPFATFSIERNEIIRRPL